jgi:Tol biopolymer transport system component
MTSTRTLRLLAGLVAIAGCAVPIAGSEKDIKPADLDSLKATGGKANGLVVWTSSRDGLPHLYTMKTDGSATRQLTTGDNTDFYPRFSPDGRRILFARSQARGFVRESAGSDSDAWDLYTVNVDGSDLKKVVEDGAWGSWSGTEEVVFLRGSKVMRAKLGAENETKVMDTARYGIFQGAIVQQPELSHDGHFVALTLAGSRRQVGIWNVRKKIWTQMGQGTQIGWAPDGASVYWIDDAGKESSRVAREPVVAGLPADEHDPSTLLLVDLGGKRSRERFPRMSNDGKWVVFGAAINDLESDLEDYELYLWEVGSTATSATRLTFHSSNDRWPDIFVGEPGKAPKETNDDAGAKSEEDQGEAQGAEQTDKPVNASPPKENNKETTDEEGAKSEPSETTIEKKPEPAATDAADESVPAPKPKAKSKKKRR